jgi:hypothetical protein
MTLVVAVTTPETIWMLADRRLSYFDGRHPKDDAFKIMLLDTIDAHALLGYSGLGSTAAFGTEPSNWMSRVLRGRDLPLEASLQLIAQTAQRELLPHLRRWPGSGPMRHILFTSAFLNGQQKFYTTDLRTPDRKNWYFQHASVVSKNPAGTWKGTLPLAMSGSGAAYLWRDKKWMRPLFRLVRACDRLRVSARGVADHFAKINFEVHQHTENTDRSVGPRCIVAWRHKEGGLHRGGGGHQLYTKLEPDPNNAALPMILRGRDMPAFLEVIMRHVVPPDFADLLLAGQTLPEIDKDKMNADLALLPEQPDEKLR